MRNSKRVAAAALGVILTLGVSASSALAIESVTAGAKAYDTNGRVVFNVHDTADDGRWVSGNWESNRGSSGSIKNGYGFNIIAYKQVVSGGELISGVKACRSNAFTPMTCDDWRRY